MMHNRVRGIVVHSFFEFFAGGGMARAGLGPDWKCLFSNDFDYKKAKIYTANWGKEPEITVSDVRKLTIEQMPGTPDLVWGSFPCQDLSLAGGGAGLKGDRSGTFWPFWTHMKGLMADGRAPKIIVLENVCGTLTSHDGKDFVAISNALSNANYCFGALVIDASLFVPHSRPRLFVIGVRQDINMPAEVSSQGHSEPWHTRGLQTAFERLSPKAKKNWVWWSLPKPPLRNTTFADLIEEEPADVPWHTREETQQLLSMMSEINREKVREAKRAGIRRVGGVYKRTRLNENGRKVQRAEIRFDDVSGCLRTPAGGSSRQVIVVVNGNSVRSRLISSRETARLMGLPEDYTLPTNYNEAYHLTGDGVVVPVVRHLARHIFEPILRPREATRAAA
jgi:DNA (cytosine-5)-methyltransferase 1